MEIACNSNSDDVILDQKHDKPNYFLPSDIVTSHLDTNLNCDDKTIIPRELEHCDNAEIHNIDFFETSSNTKSIHHSCPVSEIEVSNFEKRNDMSTIFLQQILSGGLLLVVIVEVKK